MFSISTQKIPSGYKEHRQKVLKENDKVWELPTKKDLEEYQLWTYTYRIYLNVLISPITKD